MGVVFVTRGNIQQINYIPQIEQHSPFGLMLLCLGNVTIMCVCVCGYRTQIRRSFHYEVIHTPVRVALFGTGTYSPSLLIVSSRSTVFVLLQT